MDRVSELRAQNPMFATDLKGSRKKSSLIAVPLRGGRGCKGPAVNEKGLKKKIKSTAIKLEVEGG